VATAATAAATVATGTNLRIISERTQGESSPHTIRSGAVFTAPFFYFPHAQRHRETARKITCGTPVFSEKNDNLPP
ncbi:hypothetical protein, partial [uncultured Alistipes sp.]|uniref:hypothetical protein n=1 Tax=uncultured Alistipes sp. TaxID=538949 RepID=UPI00258A9446